MIELKNIDGVFTNADQEDIESNFATTLQNYKPLNGKIVKTFGFGDLFSLDVLDIIETGYWVDSGHVWNDGQWWYDSGESMTKSIGTSIVNLVTYFNQHATTGSGYGSGDGYVFIGMVINSATCLVTFYYWTGVLWENITNLIKNTPDTFYHAYEKNPIVQENEIIRLLPGGDGQVGTGNDEAIGIWLGWIDRDYFDELYLHDTDYNSGFYQYPITPTRPDISSSGLNAVATVTAGGTWMTADGSRYYKLSNVYDGIVESLLSEEIKVTFTDNTFLQLLLTINTTTFNLRQTAIYIYRSETGNIGDAADSVDGSYEIIHKIDLTRDPDDVELLSGNSALSGSRYIYLADCGTIDITKSNYCIDIDGDPTMYTVQTPTSTTQKLFLTPSTITTESEGASWTLWSVSPGWHEEASGDICYAGDQYVFLKDEEAEFAEGVLVKSLIMINHLGTKYTRVIDGNYLRAIKLASVISAIVGTSGTKDWQILQLKNGLYYFDESGSNILLYFFDTELTEGAAYSLLNEPSIKVNGEFAVTHLGRLWQFNTVLDPGGKNETHPDWLNYSELDQYDINPVSNSIKVTDFTGGEGTGLATAFRSVLPLKKNSIHKLNISDVSDPTTWELKLLYNKKGNIAKHGWIQIDSNVYFCATDGIYELDVNINSAIDDTLFIKNRISEAINDVYLALNDISEKPYIKCGYDKVNTEIVFRFKSTSIWAFNITTKIWREIDTAKTCDIFAYDQYDNLMIFNEADDQLYSINAGTGESVGSCVATKFFNVSGGVGQRKGSIRSTTIRYMSQVALIVRCYLNGTSTVAVYDELAPALTQANWDTVAGWDLSGSTLNHSSDGAGAITPLTAISVIIGQVYKVVITLSACTVGNCTYTLGGTGGTTLSAATTYTDYVIASTTGDLTFTPSAASARFTISAVSVKQIVGGSLAVSTDIATVKMALRLRCHTFKIEVVDLTTTTSETEIYNIKIETD